MFVVKSSASVEENIKKSRFIGVIRPCAGENEAFAQIKQLALLYPGASHLAYAYRIKFGAAFIYRFNDAGEPAGTAGKPIFQHLEGKNLINTLIVVIRYFGGVKLGAGGLVRAYGNSAKRVIEAAQLEPYQEWATVRLRLDYQQIQNFDFIVKKLEGQIIEKVFSGQIQVVVRLPAGLLPELIASFPALEVISV
jgi:uncharacterized YigZ family protein